MSDDGDKVEQQIQKDVRRLQQAEEDRSTLLAHTVYIGALGLSFVLPVIGGAYLGHWLDSQLEGYSMRWTLSFMFLGIVIGAYNAYRLIRERK